GPLIGTEGYRIYPLVAYEVTQGFEVYHFEIESGVSLPADPHTGNALEIVIVRTGTLDIQVGKSETRHVKADEVLRFDATHPHHYHNPGVNMATGTMIIAYTR
ncbi:MAG: cupin domain-containing protein, partial [Chloroflexota bacterium]